jgi:signal transduction histidine kinase
VRWRAVLAAVAVIGVVAPVGGIGVLAFMRSALLDEALAGAEQRAATVLAWLDHDASHGPDHGSDAELLAVVRSGEEQFTQIIASDGRVMAASGNAQGLEAIGAELDRSTVVLPDGGAFAVVCEPIKSSGLLEGARVVTGQSLAPAEATLALLTRALWVGLPALALTVGLLTWWLVGRSLRPVSVMAREVEEISHSRLDRRLGDPGGHDEIARLAAVLNRMLARLEASQAAQRRFVSDASHELRSPLAAWRQYAEAAAARPQDTSVPELAARGLRASARAEALVEDLLVLSRSDEGGLVELARRGARVLDLDDLALDEAERLRADAGLSGAAGGARLTVDTRGVGPGRSRGNEQLLRRALANLGSNAARHARTTVGLSVHEDAGWAVVDVDDDGAGIEPADRLAVFERFARLDEARSRDGGGTGLGLAIVREIVNAHDGDVSVLDSPLGGARLRVRLPRTD